MKSKNFSFKGWDTLSWMKGRKKLCITLLGMLCTWLALDPEMTGLIAGGVVFDGVWAVLEYFLKKTEY